MFHPQCILHPTDFSDYSTQAFHIALDLARQHQARLLVLHVVETLGPENVTFGEATSQLQPQGYQHRIWEDFKQALPSTEPGIGIDYLVAEGDPAEEINEAAHDQGCDLIVMGTHGRSGLARLFMDSVAEHVIRRATCPVLVVKNRQP